MLLINHEFVENQAPPDECQEALVKPSQGKVWPPVPVAYRVMPFVRPVPGGSTRNGGKERPMWQAAFKD